MDNADRTIDRTMELPVPPQTDGKDEVTTMPLSGRGATATVTPVTPVAPTEQTEGAKIFTPGTNGTLESRIPEGMSIKRPSPALDPVRRAQISRAAKWGVLLAVLLAIAWLPAALNRAYIANGGVTDAGEPLNRAGFFIALVTAAATFSAVIAVGLPRLLLPRAFGRWHEAVEAMRDWVVVGVLTGVLYYLFILVASALKMPAANTTPEWIRYRLPLLLVAGVVGVMVARALALRREGVLGSDVPAMIGGSVLQAGLLAVLERPIELGLRSLYAMPGISTLLGLLAFLSGAAALGIVTWAASADASLSTVRRRRGASGFDDGTGPVNLTLTVIGGRESGKTVLLAAAFYEWSTQNIGNLRITPAADAVNPDGTRTGIANLEEVARELYVNSQFPVGTVSTQNLPFDLSLGNEKIARFTFLDYPGGAIAGRVADDRVVQEFWDRVEDTDGILLIADMSYVRRATKDADWLEVRNAYRTVMQRLVDRNGKRRVVPVALVLTKSDEFVDPNTGHIDMNTLKAGLQEFQYDELEADWRRLNAEHGPGFAEFQTFITSAITYSQPQLGRDGRPDYSKPFQISPPPPTITPTGCASPLLWMCAKVMRWNVTAFYDISSFLLGSTPRVRRRVDSIMEMERIAEQRAGRA